MSGRESENERPDEVIERPPVILRRWRLDATDALLGAVTESLDHLRPWMFGQVAYADMGDRHSEQIDRDIVDGEMMALALGQARISLESGGVPVGAVLAAGSASQGWQLIAAGHNERVQRGDPVAHGEIACLRNAGRRSSYRDTTLYTTLSPCQMCTGAILLFQIPRVVVGEAETFEGDLGFLAGQGVEVVLLEDPDCVAVMQEFQRRYPEVWSEDIGGR
jgi:cytosine/creatinine deaminase